MAYITFIKDFKTYGITQNTMGSNEGMKWILQNCDL